MTQKNNSLLNKVRKKAKVLAAVALAAAVLRLGYMAIDADPYFHTWAVTLFSTAPDGSKGILTQFYATHVQSKGNLFCFFDIQRNRSACLTNPDLELDEPSKQQN